MYIFLVFSQQMCTDTKTWCSTYTLPKLWQKMQHLYITKTVTENATLIHYQNLDRKCSTYTLPKPWQKMQHLYITKTLTENATLIHYQNLDRKCSTYTLPKPWQKMQHLYITKTVTENAALIHYQNLDRQCPHPLNPVESLLPFYFQTLLIYYGLPS